MLPKIQIGQRLPEVTLARANGEAFVTVGLSSLLQGRRIVMVGFPGAFTPVCTRQHIPELKAHSRALKATGFHSIICVAPNSPWVVQEWAARMDPEGDLVFLADGNLELTRAAGLEVTAPHLFLGICSARYTMILNHAVIEKLAIEANIETLSCTHPRSFIHV